MTRWTSDQLAAWQKRNGVEGTQNNVSTAKAPFHPTDSVIICLPMPPSVNGLFFNRNGRGGRAKTPEYVEWITEAGLVMASQQPPKVPGKVKILIEVAEPDTARRQDVANREKATTDLLVTHGIIQGDDQRFVREITLRWITGISGIRVTVTPCSS